MFGPSGIGAHLAPSLALITGDNLRLLPGNDRLSPAPTERPCPAVLQRCGREGAELARPPPWLLVRHVEGRTKASDPCASHDVATNIAGAVE